MRFILVDKMERDYLTQLKGGLDEEVICGRDFHLDDKKREEIEQLVEKYCRQEPYEVDNEYANKLLEEKKIVEESIKQTEKSLTAVMPAQEGIFTNITYHKDLAGHDRVLELKKRERKNG